MPTQFVRIAVLQLLILCACLLQPAASHGGEPNTLTAAERAAGWQLLFDGKTTGGWRGFGSTVCPDGWQVRDGALARVGRGGHNLNVSGNVLPYRLPRRSRL